MIKSGGASIADVKYGSQQITKAYYGSDLVFNKSDLIEYTFPNANAYCTSSNKLGFNFSGTSDGYKLMDGDSGSRFYGDAKNTQISYMADKYYGRKFYIRFPVEWDEVAIASFTIENASNGEYYCIYGSNDRAATSEWLADAGTFQTRILKLVSGSFSAANATHIPEGDNATEKIRCLKVAATWDGSHSNIYFGEYSIKFLIKRSNLKAWLDNYNLPYPANLS